MTPTLLDLSRACMALPGWRWTRGMRWISTVNVGGSDSGVVGDYEAPIAYVPAGGIPDLSDPATGGVLVHLLGPEAWRVRYSPSQHKRAAGTPWVADLVETVTLHPSQGEAAAAVAVAMGRWA